MSLITNETPVGAINGINKVFTTAQNILQITQAVVDGLPYNATIAIAGGNTITLPDAPTSSLFIDYFTSPPTPPSAGPITLGMLKIKLNFALGTTETNLLTTEKRVDAINRAIQIILENYPIPQYVVSTDVPFNSGNGPLPSDCVQPLKLRDSNDPFTIYDRVDWDDFENEIDQTYTIRYDESNLIERIYAHPTNITVLKFWYVQNFPYLVNDDDAIRMNIWWADAIAEKAAEKLLMDTAAFNRAGAKKMTADDLIAKAWQTERARITGVQDNRLKSIYSQRSLLNANRSSIAR